MSIGSNFQTYLTQLKNTIESRTQLLKQQQIKRQKLKCDLFNKLSSNFPIEFQRISIDHVHYYTFNDYLVIMLSLTKQYECVFQLEFISLITDQISELDYQICIFKESGDNIIQENCRFEKQDQTLTITIRIQSNYFTEDLSYKFMGFIVLTNILDNGQESIQIPINELEVSYKQFLTDDFNLQRIINGQDDFVAFISSLQRTEVFLENYDLSYDNELLKNNFKRIKNSNYYILYNKSQVQLSVNYVIVEIQKETSKLIIYAKGDNQTRIFLNYYNHLFANFQISLNEDMKKFNKEEILSKLERNLNNQIDSIQKFLLKCPIKDDQFQLKCSKADEQNQKFCEFQKALLLSQFEIDKSLYNLKQ